MTITTELNQSIVEYLESIGIICGININTIFINRTSMCNYDLCRGLDEGDCYKMILELIKERFSNSKYWIIYSGKTDDDYFLDVYIRTP